MKLSQEEYPFEEFASHFRAMPHVMAYEYFDANDGPMHIGKNRWWDDLRVFDYMRQHNSDKVASTKSAFFNLICVYLQEHLNYFKTSGFVTEDNADADHCSIDHCLLRALHHAFTTMTDQEWQGRGPNPEAVAAKAKQFEHEE